MDAFDEGAARARGVPLPLIGVLLGCALLAAGALVAPQFAPGLSRMQLIGGGAVAGLAIFALALAGGLSRGPVWHVGGSLVLLIGVGALAGLGASRIGHAGSAADASMFAELELNPDGTPVLPSNPGRGAISIAYAQAVRADESEAKAYAQTMGALNLGVLNSPYLLAQSPGILGKCGAIAALDPVAVAASAKQAARDAALVTMIEGSGLPDDIRRGIEMTVPETVAREEMLTQEQEMLKATGELCRLLAKRGWSNANGYFGFSSGTDKVAFDALQQRRLAVEGERKEIRDRETARFEEGRELVRAALS